jgi:hypothetical protein
MMGKVRRVALGVLITLAGFACTGTRAVSLDDPRPIWRCDLAQLGGAISGQPLTLRQLPETLVVAVTDSVELARAPRAQTDGERFLFRQLYESLLRVDCTGRVYSRLADTWFGSDGDREWTFTLRGGAVFWDGIPVTTADILASWRSRGVVLQTVASIASVTVVDDRVVTVTFPPMEGGPPHLLADPVLAVTRTTPGGAWPVGTGGFRIASAGGDPTAGELQTLTLVPADWAIGDRTSAVLVRIAPGADPRDLIDAGVDLMMTRDPDAVAYAATHSEFLSVPLPWDRAYVLMVPAATDGSFTPRGISAGLRQALARDVTRPEARASEAPFWWRILATSCEVLLAETSPVTSPERRSGRIVYLEEDPAARSLAERLVALASAQASRLELAPFGASERVAPVAAGLPPVAYGRALRRGRDLAYVTRLRRLPFDPCTQLRNLVAAAPWLGSRTGLLDAIVPLIDMRPRAIVRRGLAGLTIDLDGTVVLPLP